MKEIFLAVFILSIITFGTVAQSRKADSESLPAPAVERAVSATEPRESTDSVENRKTLVKKGEVVLPPEKRNPVRISRFSSPPVIDGRLDEEMWKQTVVLKDFYQINPGDNLPPTRSTEVMIGYDAKFLYLGFRAFEDPAKIRATVARRDAVVEDDHVRVFLDTFDDQRRAYLFFFNPVGVQQDGVYTEGVGADFSVDVVMESKGILTDDGYTVEVAIPFKSLRYEAGENKNWGIDFLRAIKHANSEISSWMPRNRNTSGVLSQFGRITGLTDISTERTLELIPSLTLSESGRRVRTIPRNATNNRAVLDPGKFVNESLKFEPGLTAKFGITPAVTLDLAINPDFAQVEADAPVVSANQRFPIFFEEKRPFFLEGVEIFQTIMNAVNTRAIVDPDYAAKLTGRRGRDTFGLLVASDNAPGNFNEDERNDPVIRPGIERFLDKNAFIGVLRLKRNVGKDRDIGFIATSYNFVERHNQLGGFDGRFRINPQTVFSFQALGTTSRQFFFDHDAGKNIYRTGNGFGYTANLQRTTRNVSVNLTAFGRTPDYRANVGFTRRVNTNAVELLARYTSEANPNGKIVSWSIGQYNNIQYDWQGRSQGWITSTFGTLNFKRQSFINLGVENVYERLFEDEFERYGGRRTATRVGAFFGTDPERSSNNKRIFFAAGSVLSKKISFNINGSYNIGALDLDLGAGKRFPRVSPAALTDPNAKLDPGAGNLLNLFGTFLYRPTDSLRVSLDYTKSRLVRRDTGKTAFDANIFSLRASNQFTRSIFARTRIDYNTLTSNVRGQFILGWAPSPGKSFYVGYNDDLNYNGFNPFTAQSEQGFSRNGRTFFVKMSYLFQRSF